MNPNLDPERDPSDLESQEIEQQLRPLSFDDFAGQDKVLENLKIFVAAANQRDEALDHVLLHGPPGLGKTTLSYILANELGSRIQVTSGPVLDKLGRPGCTHDSTPPQSLRWRGLALSQR